MRVFLSGEGADELGDLCHERQYRSSPPEVGVIEALLRSTTDVAFTIVDARAWKRIRKFKVGNHARPETRNVLGLALEAAEAGCDALVFVRDQDGYLDRQVDIEQGIRLAQERFEPAVVGGVAIREIEAWLLALHGERGSEQHANPKFVLAERHKLSTRRDKVTFIEAARGAAIPDDAVSLRDWLAMVHVCFVMQR